MSSQVRNPQGHDYADLGAVELQAECYRLRRLQNYLVSVLHIMERCPGYYTTDQESGETFHAIVTKAIAKAKA